MTVTIIGTAHGHPALTKALPTCYAEALKNEAGAMASDRVFDDCMSRHGFQFKESDQDYMKAADGQYRPTCWQPKR
jgi:hypothetical protein